MADDKRRYQEKNRAERLLLEALSKQGQGGQHSDREASSDRIASDEDRQRFLEEMMAFARLEGVEQEFSSRDSFDLTPWQWVKRQRPKSGMTLDDAPAGRVWA